MTELYPVFFGTAVLLILSGLEVLFFKLLNPRWWKKKAIRKGSFFLPVSGVIFIAVWVLGIFSYKKTIILLGATLSALSLVLILALLLALPVSGGINLIHDLIEKRKGTKPAPGKSPQAIPRRRFLKGVAAIVPAYSLSVGLSGVFHSFSDIKVYRLIIPYPDLPPELEGFRILHISDIHIGYYVWLEDVERVLKKAVDYSPDLILATGDLCDRIDVYADLLKMLDEFRAPMGAYASIGNHEYFRGFGRILRIFDNSPLPLLLNEGLTIQHRNQKIFLGGADDPRMLSRASKYFFQETVELAMAMRPADSFSILMSHRPDAFDEAARANVDLTLSGHTHGAQIGVNGRSVFESVAPEAYLWGLYRKGRSQLYTSAGMGHWFPFRFGCPSEAPIIELTRG